MPVTLIGPDRPENTIEILIIEKDELESALSELPKAERAWAERLGFAAKPGEFLEIPASDGELSKVLFGASKSAEGLDAFAYASLGSRLKAGTYAFSKAPQNEQIALLALLMEDYKFDRYFEKSEGDLIEIVVDNDASRTFALDQVAAVRLTRDLINTPTNDMGPEELSKAAKDLAKEFGGKFSEVVGDDLLKKNFPLIHAVGRASDNAPRLIDFTWGDKDAPKITLVGKGVVFDTGGLNIKTGNFMTLMKKDMGGSANVLGLARMIMQACLPVRLRVLIPAVENAISGNAFRPGDVYPSRAGLTVEISNTDAEGRLVLADALALADEEEPELIIDMATLTGAARVALGAELPPFYTNDDLFAEELSVHARNVGDPVWRMPLWENYQSMLDTPIADVNHAASSSFAGSITAALFLSRFVKTAQTWAHFDIYAWTPSPKPGHPKGGTAQAILALFSMLSSRYKN